MFSSGILRQIVILLGVGVIAYAGLILCLWAAQDWLLFPGRASAGTTPHRLSEGVEEIENLEVESGELYGLHLRAIRGEGGDLGAAGAPK